MWIILFLVGILSLGEGVHGSFATELAEVTQLCCHQGTSYARSHSSEDCSSSIPPDVPTTFGTLCIVAMDQCCKEYFQKKKDCESGVDISRSTNACSSTRDSTKNCCDECSRGSSVGAQSGVSACKADNRSTVAEDLLAGDAFTECCQKAAEGKRASQEAKHHSNPEPAVLSRSSTANTVASLCEEYAPNELCAHHCIPVPGSYRCECNPGFMLMADGRNCKEVVKNRCKPQNPCQHKCNDNGLQVKCSCRRGYQLQADGKSCEDINECEEQPSVCLPNTRCQNVQGSYKCIPTKHQRQEKGRCPPGFIRNERSNVCDDVNECELANPPCPAYLCENLVGGYKCGGVPGDPANLASGDKRPVSSADDRCPPGFRAGFNEECEDVDECLLERDDCNRASQWCINTRGAFHCQDRASRRCPPGFQPHPRTNKCEDINECEDGMDICRPDQICVNVPGEYDCKPKQDLSRQPTKCPDGLRLNPRSHVCEDIDECSEGTHLCDMHQNCLNTNGSHECRCKLGFELDHVTGGCVDVNECASDTHNCIPGSQRCDNTVGSFLCIRFASCGTGYILQAASGQCEDIDECALGKHNCRFAGAGYQCENHPGSFRCVRPHHGTTSTTPLPPEYEWEYYDSEEEVDSNHTNPTAKQPEQPTDPVTTTTPKPPEISSSSTPAEPPVITPQINVRGPELEPSERNLVKETPREHEITGDRNPSEPNPRQQPSEEEQPREIEQTRQPEQPREPEPPREIEQPIEPEQPRQPEQRQEYPEPTPPQPRYPEERREPVQPEAPPELTPNQPQEPQYPQQRTETTYPDQREQVQPTPRPEPPRQPDLWSPWPERRDQTEQNPDHSTNESIQPETTYRPETSSIPSLVYVDVGKETATVRGVKNEDGSVGIDTGAVPKNEWTKVNGRPSDCQPGFDLDAYGECVDIDECATNRHSCSGLTETCRNTRGGYLCDCAAGFRRDLATNTCDVITTPSSTAPPPPTTPIAPTVPTQSTDNTPQLFWGYPDYRPVTTRPFRARALCDVGFHYNAKTTTCEDINECTNGQANCAAVEICVNTEGGYRCECPPHWRLDEVRHRCVPIRSNGQFPTGYGNEPAYSPSQGGEGEPSFRGPQYVEPSLTDAGDSRTVITCPNGYKLGYDNTCEDIDECAAGEASCGGMSCTNLAGGYVCSCPRGHRLAAGGRCEDVDECQLAGSLPICSQNADCVNTVGSYQCKCHAGFRSAQVNDKVCVDVDECTESAMGSLCQQRCNNVWGGYRCSCHRGYRLHSDNRTCLDVDECSESRSRLLCVGRCLNEPGSYRCACPAGYRLSEDKRSCIDIDECETGAAPCASAGGGAGAVGGASSDVCVNTRGGYRCHRVACPPGYRLEHRHRCTRVERVCGAGDWQCAHQPTTYSYNFITFVSKLYIPDSKVDLFTMRGPAWPNANMKFELHLVNVVAPPSVRTRADIHSFSLSSTANQAVVSLVHSLEGPQSIELELSMKLYSGDMFGGLAVAKLYIYVSEYEF